MNFIDSRAKAFNAKAAKAAKDAKESIINKQTRGAKTTPTGVRETSSEYITAFART